MSDPMDDPAVSVYFTVDIDGAFPLGSWTTCSGLGIQIETAARGDSSMSFLMHHLSGHVTYTNVVLGRPVSTETQRVIDWMNTYTMMPVALSAEIKALDPTGSPIMKWQLWGVCPVKWTGPSFDAATPRVATEQLEIAYQGFL